MGIIEIQNLVFKYSNKTIFNNLTLNIKENSFTTIIGNNDSGKSTLVKILLGFLKSKGVYIFNKPIEKNLWFVRRNIGVVFENPSLNFVCDTVEQELKLSLKCYHLDSKKINKRILDLTKELAIADLLSENPKLLSKKQQILVSLAVALIINPKILIIDHALSDMNEEIIKMLKKRQKKGLTILNLTTNAEEILYSDKVIFLKDGQNFFTGTKAKLIKHLEVFDNCQIQPPFIIDLSNKLMFYELIDKIYTNMGTLVNNIWKK